MNLESHGLYCVVILFGSTFAPYADAAEFFNIQGDPQNGYQWNQYATAQDMLSNTNKLAQGVSVWSKEEAFFVVPEPSSIVLVCSGLGVVGLAVLRRRRGTSRGR